MSVLHIRQILEYWITHFPSDKWWFVLRNNLDKLTALLKCLSYIISNLWYTTSSWINFLVMHGSYNHPVILINAMYIPIRCSIYQNICSLHCGYNDVILSAMAYQITSLTIVYSTVYSGADQRKHQSSASLAFVRWPVNSPHKWPITRKMFWWRHHVHPSLLCFVLLGLDNKVVILYFILLILSRSLWQSPDYPSSDLKYCAIAFFQNIDFSCALLFKFGMTQCALCKNWNV